MPAQSLHGRTDTWAAPPTRTLGTGNPLVSREQPWVLGPCPPASVLPQARARQGHGLHPYGSGAGVRPSQGTAGALVPLSLCHERIATQRSCCCGGLSHAAIEEERLVVVRASTELRPHKGGTASRPSAACGRRPYPRAVRCTRPQQCACCKPHALPRVRAAQVDVVSIQCGARVVTPTRSHVRACRAGQRGGRALRCMCLTPRALRRVCVPRR